MVAEKKKQQHRLSFRFPATDEGFELVKQMRKGVNRDSYNMRTLYTGKRVPSNAGSTRKENAESIRVYLDTKIDSENPFKQRSQGYRDGLKRGREEALKELEEAYSIQENRLMTLTTENEYYKQRNESLEKLHFSNDPVNSEVDKVVSNFNEKEFTLLASKLSLIFAYIGAIENKDNYSRRIETIKQVVKVINNIKEME